MRRPRLPLAGGGSTARTALAAWGFPALVRGARRGRELRVAQRLHRQNLAKRQVKAPKRYVRDSGPPHALLGLRARAEPLESPRGGASWEGSCLDPVRRGLGAAHARPTSGPPTRAPNSACSSSAEAPSRSRGASVTTRWPPRACRRTSRRWSAERRARAGSLHVGAARRGRGAGPRLARARQALSGSGSRRPPAPPAEAGAAGARSSSGASTSRRAPLRDR